jgi:DNA-directed RNA polymerase specialized sigma subunit
MKKKMHPAKKYLLQYQKYKTMIEDTVYRKEEWEAIATSTTAQLTEKVHTSSNGDKLTNAVIKIIEIKEEMAECIVELKKKQNEIIGVIEQLEAKEYDLIHKVYVQNKTLKEYKHMKRISYSSVTTTHGKALNNVLKILERMKNNEQSRNKKNDEEE